MQNCPLMVTRYVTIVSEMKVSFTSKEVYLSPDPSTMENTGSGKINFVV